MGKYDPERSFEFWSGPDKMTAELRRYSSGPEQMNPSKAGEPYISFHGKGPRGGYVCGPGTIPQSAFGELRAMLDEAEKGGA